MPLITDPDQLNQGVEITITPDASVTEGGTITLNIAGNLSTDGVTLQALYSFLKEEWKDTSLIAYEFPMEAITPEQFEFKDGWNFSDTASVELLRNGGFAVRNTSGNITEMWAGIITLGDVGASDQIYYQQEDGAASVDVVLTGAANQCVQILSDPDGNGDYADGFDRRSFFKIFVREQAKLFAQAELSNIGVTTMTYQAYRFPLANAADTKIEELNDVTVAAYGVSIEYFGSDVQRLINGINYNFNVEIDANGLTLERVYEYVQYALRQTTDIDAGLGSVIGNVADELAEFVGNDLYLAQGVFVKNFLVADTNRIYQTDTGGTLREYDFKATGTINFNNFLQNDSTAYYQMFYTTNFGTSNAVTVQDFSDVDIKGLVGGNSSIAFDYDYDNDTNTGDSGAPASGVDKNVTVVAIGTDGAQHVVATGQITRSTTNGITLVAAQERNYANPV